MPDGKHSPMNSNPKYGKWRETAILCFLNPFCYYIFVRLNSVLCDNNWPPLSCLKSVYHNEFDLNVFRNFYQCLVMQFRYRELLRAFRICCCIYIVIMFSKHSVIAIYVKWNYLNENLCHNNWFRIFLPWYFHLFNLPFSCFLRSDSDDRD